MGVTLSAGGQRSRPVTCRNIGIGRMYLEVDPQSLQLNGQLYVGFTLARGNRQSRHRLPARVIRLARDGVGVMFSDFKPDTVNVLRELLYR